MTPEDRKIWKGNFITLGIGMVIMTATFALNNNYSEGKELKKVIEAKADKTYVDEEIEHALTEHEKREFEQLKRIEDIIILSTRNTEVIIVRIDKRLERLEDRVNEKH